MTGTPRIVGFSAWLALCLCLAIGQAVASRHAPSAGAGTFDKFLTLASPVCEHQSSLLCVDVAWRFTDHDDDQRLSLGELKRMRDNLRAWLSWKEKEIPVPQRRMVQFGLMLVDGVGLSYLVENYDTDGDGAISRTELLSDVRLDARPLGQVLLDSNAVDWDSLGRRLGPIVGALGGFGVKTK